VVSTKRRQLRLLASPGIVRAEALSRCHLRGTDSCVLIHNHPSMISVIDRTSATSDKRVEKDLAHRPQAAAVGLRTQLQDRDDVCRVACV